MQYNLSTVIYLFHGQFWAGMVYKNIWFWHEWAIIAPGLHSVRVLCLWLKVDWTDFSPAQLTKTLSNQEYSLCKNPSLTSIVYASPPKAKTSKRTIYCVFRNEHKVRDLNDAYQNAVLRKLKLNLFHVFDLRCFLFPQTKLWKLWKLWMESLKFSKFSISYSMFHLT